jgi:hypothetical protein
MIRQLLDAISRPSISVLATLTVITGAAIAVSTNLGVGLLSAAVLGVLSLAITSEAQR